MKYGFLKSVLFLSVTSAGAAVLGRGVITTFVYDIFSKCVDPSEGDAGSYMCRNVNDLVQIITFVLASLIFFGIIFVFIKEKKKLKASLLKSALLSLVYFGLLVASWKLLQDLQSNFIEFYQLKRGVPESFTQYSLILYSRISDILVGVLLGFMIWVPGAFDRHAVDADKRKEPRLTFAPAKSRKK